MLIKRQSWPDIEIGLVAVFCWLLLNDKFNDKLFRNEYNRARGFGFGAEEKEESIWQ